MPCTPLLFIDDAIAGSFSCASLQVTAPPYVKAPQSHLESRGCLFAGYCDRRSDAHHLAVRVKSANIVAQVIIVAPVPFIFVAKLQEIAVQLLDVIL